MPAKLKKKGKQHKDHPNFSPAVSIKCPLSEPLKGYCLIALHAQVPLLVSLDINKIKSVLVSPEKISEFNYSHSTVKIDTEKLYKLLDFKWDSCLIYTNTMEAKIVLCSFV